MKWLLISGVLLSSTLTAMEKDDTREQDSDQEDECCPQDFTINMNAVGGFQNLRALYIQFYGEGSGAQNCINDVCAPWGVRQKLTLLRESVTEINRLQALDTILLAF